MLIWLLTQNQTSENAWNGYIRQDKNNWSAIVFIMWRKSFCIYGNLVSRSIECKLKPQIPYISFVNKYCTNKSSSGNVESETGFKKVQQNHNWVSRFKTKLSDSTKQLTEKAESEENNDDTLSIEDNLAPRILYAVPNEKWTPIYRYDSIRLMSVLSNLKYYQVYCSVIAIAGVGFGEFCGLFEPNATAAVGVGGMTGIYQQFNTDIIIHVNSLLQFLLLKLLFFWLELLLPASLELFI